MTSPFKIFSFARFLRLGILAFSTLVAVACGGGAGTVGIATGTSLYTSAPSAITLASGSASYTIGGGTAIYKSSSSNTNVVTTNVNGTTLNIVSVTAGTAQVTVTDAAGASVVIAVTVGSGATATALFTTAPSAVTLAANVTASFTIGGGKPGYLVSSSNTAVASVAINGNSFIVTGIAAGSAQISVTDAAGTTVTIAVTVSSGAVTALFTTAASMVTLAPNVSASFTIGGGKPGYIVSSSNTAVATVAINGSSFIISGVAAGSAQVSIFDSTGTSVSVSVTIGSGGASTAFYTTAAGTVSLAASETSTFTIGGGTAPYTVSSSNVSVATASVSGTVLSLRGVAPGTAQVLVFDATGTSVAININVGSGGATTKLYTTAANAVTIAVAASNTFTIGGGSAPYTVSSSNTAIATATVSGTTLRINGIATGTAQILVFDASGAFVAIDVTCSQAASLIIDVQPNGATGNVGDVLQFLVSGGSPAYTVTVNNVSIATVTPTSVVTSGGSFSATLLNAGNTVVTIVDALGQTKSFVLTVSQLSTSLRLSPSALLIGEDSIAPIDLNIYGGTAPYRAFTSDQTLSSVSTSGATLTVAIGTNLGRCINPIDTSGVRVPNGTFDVTITVLDSLGASATSIMTIKDNGVGTGSIAPGAPPCL